MPYILSFFNPLTRLLRREKPAAEGVEPAGDDSVQLEKILMLFARRPHSDQTFRLMTREMSPDCVMFATMEHVKAGEELEVRVLLKADLSLTLIGTVNWVMQSGQGTTGQLDLAGLTQPDRQVLRSFLSGLRQVH